MRVDEMTRGALAPAKAWTCALAAAAALAGLAVTPAAGAASLPAVASGPRPGPDVLYAPPPEAPQLENGAPWRAEPILISGASAYRDGEFLYQDHLYDDRGAAGVPDRTDPHNFEHFLFAPKAGTLTYPTDPVFANNAADIVELRVKPLADATALRVTFNTLEDPARTAFTVAIGSSDEPMDWPHGAGVRSPAQLFLTVHGSQGELVDAESAAARTPAPTVQVDERRRQIDVRIPHAAWDPGRDTVRLAAGAGLWDTQAGGYLQPGREATASRPGGGAASGAALFNVAFRQDEPMPDPSNELGYTIADAAAGAAVQAAWWRERAQADALASGDISRFAAQVDFGKLAAGVTDESGVPNDGPMDRIFASRFDFGQGVHYAKGCYDVGGDNESLPERCEGRFTGQLQPYAIYVPRKSRPARGYGLTLLLHSLSANHNQYMTSRNQSQLGERGAGSIVVTPAGRGPDGWYADVAEADAFEVWADVARRYELDPDWTTVSGYSMGGYGTFRMLARWPDLFARGMATVGAADLGPFDVTPQLPSLRNTPVMAWNALLDELVQAHTYEETYEELQALGLRYVADVFPTADHLTLATNDEYAPAAEFLGEHRVERDPPRVTYVAAPESDFARSGVVADHAYWVGDIRVRDREAAPRGTIDVRSEGFGAGDPQPSGTQRGGGVLMGGAHGPMPFVRRSQDWGPAPETPPADRLVVRATNVGAATIDARRARVSCAPQVAIESDGPLELRIACAPPRRTRRASRCTRLVTLTVPRVRGRRVVDVRVARGRRTLVRRRGRNIRRVAVRRTTRRAFTLRLRARTDGRSPRTVTTVRRFPACR